MSTCLWNIYSVLNIEKEQAPVNEKWNPVVDAKQVSSTIDSNI